MKSSQEVVHIHVLLAKLHLNGFLQNFVCISEILGSHGSEYEDDSLLGYCAV
jgi:hypothetical protein